MGIEITKDLLKKIYNNYDKNKDKIPQKEIKKVKLKGIDIFKNNVKNTYNKEKYIIKNKIKKEIDNKKESKNDDKDGEVNNKINNILFRKHKSFDNIFNKDFQKEFYLSNKDSHFNNNNSFDDNKSENSDYDDISNEPILLKRTIKKKENNIKSIKLRNSYYSKLIFSNILTYKKEPKITNIFIYDWDDTLMCTSFVAPAGILNLDDLKPADKTNMKNLDQLVSTLLTKSMEHGNVFIITNAAYGWVEYSAKKLYPMTYNILKNIKMVDYTSENDDMLKIDRTFLSTDWSGNTVLVVEYTWKNTSDKTTSFMWAVSTQCFQNGVECDTALFCDDVDSGDLMKDVMPGYSITVREAYVIKDMSDVTIKCNKYLSSDAFLETTVKLG